MTTKAWRVGRGARRRAGLEWPRGVAGALLVLSITAGCQAADPLEGLPEAAVAYLSPERTSAERVAEGVTYRFFQSGHEPWTVHLLDIDARRCEVGFRVMGLEDPEGGRLTVTELAEQAGPGVVAAVNGDFFTPENASVGVEASAGAVRGRTSRPVFAWRPGALPRLADVEWKGDSLVVGSWQVVRGVADGRTELVAGFPRLLSGGARVGDLEAAERPAFSASRHPRTAVGWDEDLSRLWIVVVDGRREGVSEGMTLAELAGLFEALGAEDALNLDGGGSSTMVLGQRVVSRPSDPTGPRAVVNALVVREDASLCALTRQE
jgi:hypothetical protein